MGQRMMAIDVSPTAVRLVALETTFRKAEVILAHSVAIDPGMDRAAMWQAVRDYIPKDVDGVIVSADPKVTSTRAVTFPFVDPRKIEPALEFELESQVPYELEQTAVAWHLGEVQGTQAHVLTALSPKAQVQGLIDELAQVGLEPRAVVYPPAALAELLPESDEAVAVISLGATTSHVAVVRRGLLFARTLRTGGAEIDRRIAQRVGVDLHDARRIKEGLDLRSDTAVTDERTRHAMEALAMGLAPLLREISTTLRALPADQQPTRVVLTGGMSRLSGLSGTLEQRLGLPVKLLDLPGAMAPVEIGNHRLGPEMAVAAGMALGLHKRGRNVGLNFRRADLAYHGDLQVYRGEFTRIAVGLGALLLLAMIGSIVQYTMISAEERQLTQGFCEATQKIVGREICDPVAALATMRQTPGSGEGVEIPPYSAASLFMMMSNTLGKDIDVTFSDLEFRADGRDTDRISGKGEAASFDTIEEVASKLRQDRCVKSAEVSRQKKTDNGRVEFSLAVQIACPAGVTPGRSAPVASSVPAPPRPPSPGE